MIKYFINLINLPKINSISFNYSLLKFWYFDLNNYPNSQNCQLKKNRFSSNDNLRQLKMNENKNTNTDVFRKVK